MADFTVFIDRLKTSSGEIKKLSTTVSKNRNRVDSVSGSLSFEIKQKTNIQKNLKTISNDLSSITVSLKSTSSVLTNIARFYEKAKQQNVEALSNAKAAGSDKGKSGSNPYKDIYNAYNGLPKEWQEFIDMVLGAAVGTDTGKLTKVLMKLFSGNFKWKDAWSITDVVTSTVFNGVGGTALGLTPVGVAYTYAKTLLSNPTHRSNSMLAYEGLKKVFSGNFSGALRDIAGYYVGEKKLKYDATCKVVDSVFKVSQINTAIKIMYKVDLGKGFTNATKIINSTVDSVVSGQIFTKNGFRKLSNLATSIFDKRTYMVKR